MGRITRKCAESMATEIIEKLESLTNKTGDVKIEFESEPLLEKQALVETILKDENIYIPFKRTVKFNDLQDETVRNICKPVGTVTMTETFNKGYKAEELIKNSLDSLDVHCEGIKTNDGISYEWCGKTLGYDTTTSGKDYAVTYSGRSEDGNEFSANAIYNAVNPNTKAYYISKVAKSGTLGEEKQETNIITSSGESLTKVGTSSSKIEKFGSKEYQCNHYEGTITRKHNSDVYTWEDNIKEECGRVIASVCCISNSKTYTGTPSELTINDFTTGSVYKEENGVITNATGTLAIACKYDENCNIVFEKPTFSKEETIKVINNSIDSLNNGCIALVSVQNNYVTNTKEVVITPNYALIKNKTDIEQIVSSLKKWNIGSTSNVISLSNNNIWVNDVKTSDIFSKTGKYNVNSYSTLSEYFQTK